MEDGTGGSGVNGDETVGSGVDGDGTGATRINRGRKGRDTSGLIVSDRMACFWDNRSGTVDTGSSGGRADSKIA
jgi:hypothetical protein